MTAQITCKWISLAVQRRVTGKKKKNFQKIIVNVNQASAHNTFLYWISFHLSHLNRFTLIRNAFWPLQQFPLTMSIPSKPPNVTLNWVSSHNFNFHLELNWKEELFSPSNLDPWLVHSHRDRQTESSSLRICFNVWSIDRLRTQSSPSKLNWIRTKSCWFFTANYTL